MICIFKFFLKLEKLFSETEIKSLLFNISEILDSLFITNLFSNLKASKAGIP